MEKEYVIVTWPESQELTDKEWYDECILINEEPLLNQVGPSAYFVPENRFNELQLNSLEFHHLEPKHKDFHFGSTKTTNIDKIKKELEKCILVCANCHREIHYPQNNL